MKFIKIFILIPVICVAMIFTISFDSHWVYFENTSQLSIILRKTYELGKIIDKLMEEQGI